MEEAQRRLKVQARREAVSTIGFLVLVAMMTSLIAFLSIHEHKDVLLGTVITTWGVTVNQCRQHFGAIIGRVDIKGEVIHTRHEVRELLNTQGLAQRDRDETVANNLIETNKTLEVARFTEEEMRQLEAIFTKVSVESCQAIVEIVVKKAIAEYHQLNHSDKA